MKDPKKEKELKEKIGRPVTKHHYYGSVQSSEIGFIRFDNAYTGNTKRIKLSGIVDYNAFDYTSLGNGYSKSYVKDLGDTGYAIDLNYSHGHYRDHHRVFFWTEQQRDETLFQLDITLGVYEMTPEPKVTVLNPKYDRIPEGSTTIQELPDLEKL